MHDDVRGDCDGLPGFVGVEDRIDQHLLERTIARRNDVSVTVDQPASMPGCEEQVAEVIGGIPERELEQHGIATERPHVAIDRRRLCGDGERLRGRGQSLGGQGLIERERGGSHRTEVSGEHHGNPDHARP